MNYKPSHPKEARPDFLMELLEEDAEAPQDTPFARIAAALPFSLELQTPPAELKPKILSAVRALEQNAGATRRDENGAETPSANLRPPVQLWKNWTSQSQTKALTVQRRDEGQWEKTGVAGVEVKQLYVDHERDYVTMLVRMQPGSSYPSHRHDGYEECYVLQGDLSVGETTLRAGDYQRAEGGSVHVVQSTAAGCLLLIVSSQHDELLA
jgi:anti-sigma factor ChrR (cupin superfamily)